MPASPGKPGPAYARLSHLRREIKRKTLMTPLDPIVASIGGTLEHLRERFAPSPVEETEVQLEGGYLLAIPPKLPYARRLWSGTYEPEVTNVIRSLLAPGMTLVDAGANVGYYALIGAQLVGDSGRVYAFEPDQEAYKYLETNIRRNETRNVVPIRNALADKGGSLPFISTALDRGALSFTPATEPSSVIVETVSLDGFFAQLGWPPVDVVKLDVEGAEWAALVGMRELSARNPSMHVVMEFNLAAMTAAGRTPRDMSDVLRQLGFRIGYILQKDREQISLAKPLPATGLTYDLLVAKQ